MNIPVTSFKELGREQKIEFFVKCQELLSTHHPDSEFAFRQDNAPERMTHAKGIIEKYRGLCYMDDNICVLFNKIIINDPNDPVAALKDNMFKDPSPNYNGISIDFVVFRKLKDCAAWCQSQYDPRIAHILFVKNNKPQIYKTENLIAKIFQLPVAP